MLSKKLWKIIDLSEDNEQTETPVTEETQAKEAEETKVPEETCSRRNN